MTAPPGDLVAYHLGFVVRDLEAVAGRYQRTLGIERWRTREMAMARTAWDANSSDARLRVAFGRAAGLTFELIQVLEGRTPHLDFLEQHGEGVQHIGFWAPDVRAAVEHAVNGGGRITLARFDPDGNAEVQLSPGASMETIVGMLPSDRMAYVDPGLGGVQLEFVGRASADGMREWLAADFNVLLQPSPPWS
jgi:catechol 2,3-dioxygenase-like lactoylglutathione lyase family enzyme